MGGGRGLKETLRFVSKANITPPHLCSPLTPPGLFPHTDVFVASPCHAYKARPSPQRPLSQMIHAVQPDTF